jgi:hypothetical protein
MAKKKKPEKKAGYEVCYWFPTRKAAQAFKVFVDRSHQLAQQFKRQLG